MHVTGTKILNCKDILSQYIVYVNKNGTIIPKRCKMRKILHSDMNNFYASVECMLNPELKGYPVAVCGNVEKRHGIVLAKNYAAKAFGVSTGEAVWQAQQKCPNLVVIPPHFEEYIKYSKLARSIYQRYTNQVEPYGMDECWLDITGFGVGDPTEVAHEIRNTIKEELGLTVSVGVSYNKIFAKLGSDMKKPDAVTTIHYDSFKEKIWGLPASDLLFVGRSTKRVLDRFYIKTIGDLANTSPDFLKSYLGVNGIKLWRYANGYDNSPVMDQDYHSPVKSVGHGTTTVEDLKSNFDVWLTVLELSQDIGHRLKLLNLNCTGISINVRNSDLECKEWQTKISFPTQSPYLIAKLAFDLFLRRYTWQKPIRSITVRAINLLPDTAPIQMDLFSKVDDLDKQQKIDDCVDSLRERFGKNIVINAVLLNNCFMQKNQVKLTMPTGMMNMR